MTGMEFWPAWQSDIVTVTAFSPNDTESNKESDTSKTKAEMARTS